MATIDPKNYEIEDDALDTVSGGVIIRADDSVEVKLISKTVCPKCSRMTMLGFSTGAIICSTCEPEKAAQMGVGNLLEASLL